MKIKVQIKTPKGAAEKTEKKIRPFILGFTKYKSLYLNPDNDTIFWEIEGTPKEVLKINRNVAMFDKIIKNIFENKKLKKHLPKFIGKDQEKELKEMLLKHTKLTIIKEATAQELQEDGKTFWEKVKEKFKKT